MGAGLPPSLKLRRTAEALAEAGQTRPLPSDLVDTTPGRRSAPCGLFRLPGQRNLSAMHAAVRSVAVFTLVGGATLFAAQSPSSAPQAPTFRTGVEYVEVDAVVTDPDGNIVADLT